MIKRSGREGQEIRTRVAKRGLEMEGRREGLAVLEAGLGGGGSSKHGSFPRVKVCGKNPGHEKRFCYSG